MVYSSVLASDEVVFSLPAKQTSRYQRVKHISSFCQRISIKLTGRYGLATQACSTWHNSPSEGKKARFRFGRSRGSCVTTTIPSSTSHSTSCQSHSPRRLPQQRQRAAWPVCEFVAPSESKQSCTCVTVDMIAAVHRRLAIEVMHRATISVWSRTRE